MGLFTKHKEDRKIEAIQAVPPLPPIGEPEEKTEMNNGNSNFVSAPPMPGSGLEDIKSQVTNNEIQTSQFENNSNQLQTTIKDTDLDFNTDLNVDDSLFDFSETDVSKDNILNDLSQISESKPIDSNLENVSNLNFVNNSSHYNNALKDETYFVTTSQFKTLLEIVDSVKERISNSSDSHLRLLDIKSEEDIEYENLRKDFQFVEDKLYELDSIIFEK